MQATLTQFASRSSINQRLLLLCAFFWLFTYALLSIRAGMIPEDVPALLSARRLIAVTAGAAIFYGAAWRLVQDAVQPRAVTILGTLAVSVAAALIIRLGLDQLTFEDTNSVGYSIRWTLIWTGYFGVCLMGTLAYFERIRGDQLVCLDSLSSAPSRQSVRSANEDDSAAWMWLIDVLAFELADDPSIDRKALAAKLVIKAGYEVTDSLDHMTDVHNARVRLALAIFSRISREYRRVT